MAQQTVDEAEQNAVLLDQRVYLLRNHWFGQNLIPHLLPPDFPAEAIPHRRMDMHRTQSHGNPRVFDRRNIRLLSNQLRMDAMGWRAQRTLCEQ